MAGRLAACWLALRLLVPVCVVALAQSDQTTPQDQAKAAFLASFSKYVTWPDGFVPVSDLIIGVVGPSSITAPLEQQAEQHKTSKQRIEVRRFASIAGEGDSPVRPDKDHHVSFRREQS